MRTIEKTVFTFDELSESAKEKARDWYRVSDDGYYLDYVISDFKEIGQLIGLEVDDVFYNVAHCQGDYASFSGTWNYKAGCLKAIKAYAPQDTKLHGIIYTWVDFQKSNFYRLTVKPSHGRDWQSAESVYIPGDDYRDYSDQEKAARDICRDLAHWLYKQLRDEVEYQNSDEAIDEAMEANAYEFYENGERA